MSPPPQLTSCCLDTWAVKLMTTVGGVSNSARQGNLYKECAEQQNTRKIINTKCAESQQVANPMTSLYKTLAILSKTAIQHCACMLQNAEEPQSIFYGIRANI
jgi:hypothetical protein